MQPHAIFSGLKLLEVDEPSDLDVKSLASLVIRFNIQLNSAVGIGGAPINVGFFRKSDKNPVFLPLEDAVCRIDDKNRREGLEVEEYSPEQMRQYLTPFLLERLGQAVKLAAVFDQISDYRNPLDLRGKSGNFSFNTPIEVYGILLMYLCSRVSLEHYPAIIGGLTRVEPEMEVPEGYMTLQYTPEMDAHSKHFLSNLGKIKDGIVPKGREYLAKIIGHAGVVLGDGATLRERLDYFVAFMFSDYALSLKRIQQIPGTPLIYDDISRKFMDIDAVINSMPCKPLQRSEMQVDQCDNGVLHVTCGNYHVVVAHGEYRGNLARLISEFHRNGGTLVFEMYEDQKSNSHIAVHTNETDACVIQIYRNFGDAKLLIEGTMINACGYEPGLLEKVQDIMAKTSFNATIEEATGRTTLFPKTIISNSQRYSMASEEGRKIYLVQGL